MKSFLLIAAVLLGSLALAQPIAQAGPPPNGPEKNTFDRGNGVPDLYGASYKPSHYCPANQTCFKHAHWRSYGPNKAVAIATGSTYYPGATHGTKGTAKFEFERPKHICRGTYFTKATWRYKSQNFSTSSTLVSVGSSCYWTGA